MDEWVNGGDVSLMEWKGGRRWRIRKVERGEWRTRIQAETEPWTGQWMNGTN